MSLFSSYSKFHLLRSLLHVTRCHNSNHNAAKLATNVENKTKGLGLGLHYTNITY